MKISDMIEILESAKEVHGDKPIKILSDLNAGKADLDLMVKTDGLWLQ